MGTVPLPVSNPAGNNQTTPGAGSFAMPQPIVAPAKPGAGANSFVPITAGATPSVATPTPATVPVGTSTSPSGPVAGASSALTTQYNDIYGSGVGGALSQLIGSLPGQSAASLQAYINSLMPQEATAQANVNASLGAAGVGANSSVAAIGDANLQAQETAAIGQEESQLTLNQEQLEGSLLSGTENAAVAENASSGWDVFGQVLQGLGGLAGAATLGAGEAGGFSKLF